MNDDAQAATQEDPLHDPTGAKMAADYQAAKTVQEIVATHAKWVDHPHNAARWDNATGAILRLYDEHPVKQLMYGKLTKWAAKMGCEWEGEHDMYSQHIETHPDFRISLRICPFDVGVQSVFALRPHRKGYRHAEGVEKAEVILLEKMPIGDIFDPYKFGPVIDRVLDKADQVMAFHKAMHDSAPVPR